MAAVSYTFSFEKKKKKEKSTSHGYKNTQPGRTQWKRDTEHTDDGWRNNVNRKEKGNVSFSSFYIENRKETEKRVGRPGQTGRARTTDATMTNEAIACTGSTTRAFSSTAPARWRKSTHRERERVRADCKAGSLSLLLCWLLGSWLSWIRFDVSVSADYTTFCCISNVTKGLLLLYIKGKEETWENFLGTHRVKL